MNTKIKILITGATGFLGKHVSLRLASEGYQVRGIGRNAEIGALLQKNGVEFRSIDLIDRSNVMTACKGVDYVMHCAALSTPWGQYDDFYKTNVLGTRHVIAGCLEHQVKRLIHISSPSIYFNFKDRFEISENEPLDHAPCNTYALTKLLAEKEIDRVKHLPVITLRPRGIFGPGDNAILPRLIEANRKKRLPLIAKGNAIVDLTYVDNVVDAMILCLNSPENTLRKKYNITNGEPQSLKDLMKALFDSINEPFCPRVLPYPFLYSMAWAMEKLYVNEPPFTRYTIGVLAKSQTLDIQAARQELGYKPRVSISQGITLFANWWKKAL